jgi:hypothetical protein
VRLAWLSRVDPKPRAITTRTERLVVSLTTVPERVLLIRPVLRSLVDQTCPADRIILVCPERCLRTGSPYPPIPELPPGVEVVRCEDQGPATKLLPVLRLEHSAIVVAVDDDVFYPADFLETLLAAHRSDPTSAWGWRGWQFRRDTSPRLLEYVFATAINSPTDVDVLFGTWGYLIPPGALDQAVQDFGDLQHLRWVDDIWISGHLARRGVRRRVVAARSLPLETRASSVAALCDGFNRSGDNEVAGVDAFRENWNWLGESTLGGASTLSSNKLS